MTNARKRILSQTSKMSSFSKREIVSTVNLLLHTKRCNGKPRYAEAVGSIRSKKKASEISGGWNGSISLDRKRMRRTAKKAGNVKNANKKTSELPLCRNASHLRLKQDGKNTASRVQRINKRRKNKKKKNVELDEASRLQRRTRYLLIKMKLEQNLIDAYSAEGWKGQSREKIRPEKELQRAMKQILRCKLGIREAIHQLELLSSEGCIEDAVINPDGSVFHEHIFCAKCKSRDVFQDNDIILCDGTCNCAFHQKCLEPPLATENIPPGDQGWLCKFCECKMEILEAVNAHMGTRFAINSNWQDVFKEAATAPDGENTCVDPAEEWPSDDSSDEDYNPEFNTKVGSQSETDEDALCDDASSSSSLFWSSDEASSQINILNGEFSLKSRKGHLDDPIISIHSVNSYDCDIMGQRRQRKDVDYKKLYDEMFGKAENEQLSEDEDWGPQRKKQRVKELDASMVVVGLNNENNCVNKELRVMKKLPTACKDRKPLFRIPPNAVEKLRQVFSENELPSRAIREHLSNQLGIASEKVNKWFKNARYMALKIRKEENRRSLCSNEIAKASNTEIGKNHIDDKSPFTANSCLVSSATSKPAKNLRRICLRKNLGLLATPLKKQCSRSADALSSNIIQVGHRIHSKKKMTCLRKKSHSEKSKEIAFYGNETRDNEQIFVEMERLCHLEDRVEKLNKLLKCISSNETCLDEELVICVPVVEVKEKARTCITLGS